MWPKKLSSRPYIIFTGRSVWSASRQAWTCIERSSRPPNAPPTPPSTSRTFSGGRSSEAASWSRSTCSHWVAMKRSTPPSSAGTASPDSGPRNAWSCMPTSYSPVTTTSPVGVRVAVADRDVAQQVAARVQRRGGRVERALGVGQRLEHLVVDLDLLGRRARGLGVVGGDDRDRLALVADVLPREHGLVGDLQPVGLAAGHVLVGEHGLHAGHAQRGADLDRADLRARVRRAQGGAPQHPVRPRVGGVGELALDLRDPVGAADALADARAGLGDGAHARIDPRAAAPAGATGRAGRAPRRPRRTCAARRRRRRRGRRPAACPRAGAGRARARRPGRRSPRGRRRRAATARRRRACPAPASRSRPRGRGSARRGSCPARAPRARRARAGRGASRAANSAWRSSPPSSPASLEAAPSTPSPTGAPLPISARTGAMPAPSRALELGQCATPVPVSPKRRTSCSSRCTQCASQTSSPSQPSRSRYSTGRQPNSSMQKRSSSSVSAMCVCSRTPRARASSADSRISSCVTLNGEQGASAIRTIASGEGSWCSSIAASQAARIASRSSTTSSGGSPPAERPEVHRAAARVEAQADLARRLDLDREQVAGVAGEEVVVVGGGRAARAGERDEPGARRRLLDRGVDVRPDRIERPAATRTACCPARARAWPTGRGGGGS